MYGMGGNHKMQLHYQSYGQGRPLIVLHGLFGSSTNWNSLSKALADRYCVLAVDQRNHGSSPHSDDLSYALLADDLHEFMQQQQLQSAYLLGHSMGGKTVMEFSLRYPAAVERLVVVDIAPRPYPPRHDEIFEALCDLDLSAYSSRSALDAALAERIPDLATRQFLLTNATRDESGGFRWKLNLPAIEQNYAEISSGIQTGRSFDGPTLFVRGERSDYVQPADEPQIRTLFPQSTIVTVSGAGHWIHAEAPAEFARIVREFLPE